MGRRGGLARLLASWSRVGLLSALALAGCARGPRETVSYLWQSMPSVPWPSSKSADAEPDPSAPTVTANAAATTDTENATAAAEPQTESAEEPSLLSTLWPAKSEAAPEAVDPFLVAELETQAPKPADTVRNQFVAGFDSQLERLRKVLTNDARRSDSLPESVQQRDEVRLRVDSLLQQARSELEAGRLDDADRSARTALSLGEAAHLIYAPDEERPVDLLQKIKDRRDGITVAASPQPPSTEPATVPEKRPAETVAVPVAANETEPATLQATEWEISTAGGANLPRTLNIPELDEPAVDASVLPNQPAEPRTVVGDDSPSEPESTAGESARETATAAAPSTESSERIAALARKIAAPPASAEPAATKDIRLSSTHPKPKSAERPTTLPAAALPPPIELTPAESPSTKNEATVISRAGVMLGTLAGLGGLAGLILWRRHELRRYR